MQESSYLIVGLGNPGKEYEKTRHNIGAKIIDDFGRKKGWSFRKSRNLKAKISEGCFDTKRIILLLPSTFINESGVSVSAAVDYFRIPLENILIVVDDAAIEWGEFRLKDNSGSGGHKGLQNIEDHLKTNRYPRLRIGIGDTKEDLVSHVLGRFSEKEEIELPNIVMRAMQIIEMWVIQGITLTMNVANIRRELK